MGLMRTTIKKGDKVKVINTIDGYRTKFPAELKLGETYFVENICDDYFDGHFLIIIINNKKIIVSPQGFSHNDSINTERFEIIGCPGKNSQLI